MPARPTDPHPIAPRHGQVVDGAHLTLRWEPHEHAESLHVEVAEDQGFEQIVCAEEVPADADRLVLQRCFPDEGRTFYWRVRAHGPGGWSPGDRIEGFTSGSADDVALSVDPDEEEPLGPVRELFRVAHLQGMAELTPGRQPAADRAVGGRAEGLEGAEIVTVGMTFIVAAAAFLLVVLVILFFAC